METKRSRHILDLTNNERKHFLNSFDIVMCDCDGVIWEVHRPIENAGKAINYLKNLGKKFIYISNNSVREDDVYLKNFQDAGIETDMNDVYHPLKNIIEYLKSIHFNGLIYCVATSAFKMKLIESGFNVIDGPNKILDETFNDLAKNVFDKEPVNAVIIDVDFNLSAPKLIKADLYLRNSSNCIFIAGATDMKLPIAKGVTIIGPGPYINVVSQASGKNPVVLGKPGKDLGEFLIQHYNINDRKRVLVVGDMIQQDIAFGKNCGFQTLVVLTGGCGKEELENSTNGPYMPDYYANSIAEFLNFITEK